MEERDRAMGMGKRARRRAAVSVADQLTTYREAFIGSTIGQIDSG